MRGVQPGSSGTRDLGRLASQSIEEIRSLCQISVLHLGGPDGPMYYSTQGVDICGLIPLDLCGVRDVQSDKQSVFQSF